jgi:hypothetical protein
MIAQPLCEWCGNGHRPPPWFEVDRAILLPWHPRQPDWLPEEAFHIL